MGMTHLDEAPSAELSIGHLKARWTALGQAARSERVGVRRIEVADGFWSTPCHEHGVEEEIFYVLGGAGLVWQDGRTCEIRAGDCIVFLANRGAHSMHAVGGTLDLLAFGPRVYDEAVGFPRLGRSLVGRRAVTSEEGAKDGLPFQFVEAAEVGPPPLGDGPGERFRTVVNVDDVAPDTVERQLVTRTRRDLGRAAGSRTSGLKHCEVAPGKEATPMHCHSLEEEIFVVLDGDGALLLDGEEETPIRAGHVIARPAGTGVGHVLRAGDAGMTFLAYGPRETNDICFYPRSNKVFFRGIDLIARIEGIADYWDGEPD